MNGLVKTVNNLQDILNNRQVIYLDTTFHEKYSVIEKCINNSNTDINSSTANKDVSNVVNFDFRLLGLTDISTLILSFPIFLQHQRLDTKDYKISDYEQSAYAFSDLIKKISFSFGDNQVYNITNTSTQYDNLIRKAFFSLISKKSKQEKKLMFENLGLDCSRKTCDYETPTEYSPTEVDYLKYYDRNFEALTSSSIDNVVIRKILNIPIKWFFPLMNSGSWLLPPGQRVSLNMEFKRVPIINSFSDNNLVLSKNRIVPIYQDGKVQTGNNYLNTCLINLPDLAETLIFYNYFKTNLINESDFFTKSGTFVYYDIGNPIVIQGQNQTQIITNITSDLGTGLPQALMIYFKINNGVSVLWRDTLVNVKTAFQNQMTVRRNNVDDFCGGFTIDRMEIFRGSQRLFNVTQNYNDCYSPNYDPIAQQIINVKDDAYQDAFSAIAQLDDYHKDDPYDFKTSRTMTFDGFRRNQSNFTHPLYVPLNPNPNYNQFVTTTLENVPADITVHINLICSYKEEFPVSLPVQTGLPTNYSLVILPIYNIMAQSDANGQYLVRSVENPGKSFSSQYPNF